MHKVSLILSLLALAGFSFAQTSELGSGDNTPSNTIRPQTSSAPRSSPRPIAADTLYRNFNSNLFCSPPPRRSECPTYTQAFAESRNENWGRFEAKTNNGRPCFVRHDSVKDTQFPNEPYSSYSIYSTANPNVFEADVPIMFDHSRLTGPDKEKQYSDFLKRAQACLDSGRPPISDGSKTLKIKIIPLSATDLKASNEDLHNQTTWEANQVSLHPSYPREDSGNYSLNSSCETISHEIMHLLGLHDEYHESDMTYTPSKHSFESELGINIPQSVYDAGIMDQTAYDCRQSTAESNLMNDHTEFDRSGFIAFNCNLDRDTGAFQTQVEFNPGETCPPTHSKHFIGTFSNMSEMREFQTIVSEHVTEIRTRRHNTVIYRPLRASDMPTALRRGQISQILRPNCMSRPEIRSYLSASRNAYENRYTAENGGQCPR